jgi:hypothetical protein
MPWKIEITFSRNAPTRNESGALCCTGCSFRPFCPRRLPFLGSFHLPKPSNSSSNSMNISHDYFIANLLALIQHLLEHLFNLSGAASSEAKPVIHPLFQPWHTKIPRFKVLLLCATQLTRITPYLTVLARPSDSTLHVELWLRKTRYLDPHTRIICE